jgi:hyperosmotically inducible periplasmic protein
MRNKMWGKPILIMVPLFLVMAFVNIAGASDADSYKDMALTSKVEAKLQADSQLMGSKISVETNAGEVTLKGMVDSQADITRAAQLASYVDGVKKVDNRLTTVSSHRFGRMAPRPNCQIGANWDC